METKIFNTKTISDNIRDFSITFDRPLKIQGPEIPPHGHGFSIKGPGHGGFLGMPKPAYVATFISVLIELKPMTKEK